MEEYDHHCPKCGARYCLGPRAHWFGGAAIILGLIVGVLKYLGAF